MCKHDKHATFILSLPILLYNLILSTFLSMEKHADKSVATVYYINNDRTHSCMFPVKSYELFQSMGQKCEGYTTIW